MKKIALIVLFANIFLIGSIQAQDIELSQLLGMQNKSAMLDFEGVKSDKAEEALSFLLQTERNAESNLSAAQASQAIQTYNVQIVIYGGYSFHMADYGDGTRIVTCLDGAERGLQGIGYRGVIQLESRNVQWNNGYFVHFYPGGRVTSFPNRQIAELY